MYKMRGCWRDSCCSLRVNTTGCC